VIGSVVMAIWVVLLPRVWPDLHAGMLLLMQVSTGAVLYALVLVATSYRRLREIIQLIRGQRGRMP
jgi:ABC-type spermidine/putrescine transport system permease subunit II